MDPRYSGKQYPRVDRTYEQYRSLDFEETRSKIYERLEEKHKKKN